VETSGVTHVFDRIILLTAIWSPAFYHSTIEQLPRLLFISDFIEANPNITVVARKNDESLDQDALFYIYAKVWNLESRILFLEDKDVIYANLMYIPEPSPCGALQPLMAQITQSAVRAKVASVLSAKRQGDDAKVVVPNARQRRRLGSSGASTPSVANDSQEEYDNNHIVVVRRRGNRGLRNHDELLTTLQTTFPNETWFDFDDANTTGTFPSVGLPQWTAFAQAKIIVAPHGAGLSNMIGCRPGTHIVELFGDGYDLNLCYLHLTVGLNMNHHPLLMDNHDQNGQYNANVANVVKIVKDILQMQAAATAG
jgi:Glycosyltransferase 61